MGFQIFGSCIVIFLRNHNTRICNLACILADRCPPCSTVGKNHRVIIMERQNNILVSLRNFKVLHRFVTLPTIATYNQSALRFTFTKCFMNLGNQSVPLFVIFCYRFIHEFVGNRIVAISFKYIRELVPHINETLLRFLRCEQCIGVFTTFVHGIEIVRTNNV